MMKFKHYLISVSIALFIACSGSKKVVIESKTKTQTVTVVDEIKLDTTIVIPKQQVSLFVPIAKAKFKSYVNPKVYKQTKGIATVVVKLDSTGITAISNCDSIAQKLSFYKKRVKQMSSVVAEVKKTEKVKKGFNLFDLVLYITAFSIVSFVAGYLIKTFKII